MINFFLHVQIFHPFEYFRISVKPNMKPTLSGVLAVTTVFYRYFTRTILSLIRSRFLRYTNADLKISQYVCVHIKTIP